MLDPDTIVAISTPPGRGGIGIVRLSGPRALEIASPLLRLRHPLAPGRARFAEILDLSEPERERVPRPGSARAGDAATNISAGDPPSNLGPRTSNPVLDQAIATYFAAPRSSTGEDVLEIAAHGSPVLLETIVRQCCLRGARLAEPGEFTQRAFLAGRIDLTQAEAVHDLIASSTLEQARLAARQLSGSLAHSIAPIKSALVALIAALEAGIDFAEDDIDVLPPEQIESQIAAIHAPLAALERTFATGRVLRDGFRLAIVGRPNAGKSSLFNRLVQRDRAIVTASPGTTRDLVTETVAIDGIPVHLVDTAGLRDSSDEAERLGVAKSRQAMADADLVLLVLDAPALATANALAPEDAAILARHAESAPTPGSSSGLQPAENPRLNQPGFSPGAPSTLLLALNKIDLLPNPSQNLGHLVELLQLRLQIEGPVILNGRSESKGPEESRAPTAADTFLPTGPSTLVSRISYLDPRTSNLVPTSALTSAGIPELRAAIVAAVAGPAAAPREAALLTNLRQHQAVQESLRALAAARTAAAARIPHEMLLLDLYAALRALDTLTGATTTDDLLRLIFSTFCIGK